MVTQRSTSLSDDDTLENVLDAVQQSNFQPRPLMPSSDFNWKAWCSDKAVDLHSIDNRLDTRLVDSHDVRKWISSVSASKVLELYSNRSDVNAQLCRSVQKDGEMRKYRGKEKVRSGWKSRGREGKVWSEKEKILGNAEGWREDHEDNSSAWRLNDSREAFRRSNYSYPIYSIENSHRPFL
jgi:hypothetical protein